MKKTRPILSLLLLLALLAGCGQDPAPAPPDITEEPVISPIPPEDETNTSVIPLPNAFSLPYDPDDTLDPLTCRDGTQLTLAALLYEGLFALDESFQPIEILCDGYESSDMHTVWSFRIREGILFSDGSPLTAADVAATLNRARETDRYRSRLSNIMKVTYSGDTVTVTLSAPNTMFPALLDIPIVKKGTERNSAPTGTGPYRFAEENSSAMLLPSETRRSTEPLPVDSIPLTECSSTATLYHRFSSRDIQLLVTDLTGPDAFHPTGSISIRDANTTVLQFIGFNTAQPLFSSANLRNALGLGIDRTTLVNTYLAGHAVAAQSPVSPASSLYPAALDMEYSRNTFLEAMAAAGYCSGTPHDATLLVNSENRFKVSAAQFLADTLSAGDIKITVKALPWAEYTAALMAGDFDLYYGEVKLSADWDLSQLVGTGGSLNFGGYSSSATDVLLSGYAAAETPASALRSLCRYLQTQAPIIPLCFKCSSVLTESGVVEGLSPTAANSFRDFGNITINLSKDN